MIQKVCFNLLGSKFKKKTLPKYPPGNDRIYPIKGENQKIIDFQKCMWIGYVAIPWRVDGLLYHRPRYQTWRPVDPVAWKVPTVESTQKIVFSKNHRRS